MVFYLSLQRQAMSQQSSSQVRQHCFSLRFTLLTKYGFGLIYLCVLAYRKVWAHEEDWRLLCCCSRRHKCWAGNCHSYPDRRAQIHPHLCKGKSTFQQAVNAVTRMKSCLFLSWLQQSNKKLLIDDAFFFFFWGLMIIDLCIFCKDNISTVVLAKQVRSMSAEL